MKTKVFFCFLLLWSLTQGTWAWAQSYPPKPVSLMVAYPAGGSTDVGARILAGIAELKEILAEEHPGVSGPEVSVNDITLLQFIGGRTGLFKTAMLRPKN